MSQDDLKAAGGVLLLFLDVAVAMYASTKMRRSFMTWFFLSLLVSPIISFPFMLFLGPQAPDEAKPPPKPSSPGPELVPFYDVADRRVIRIPRKELAPGCVLAKIDGIGVEEPVWVAGDQLQPGPLQHPPFDEEVRTIIGQVHAAFAEHRPLTLDEWEEGFRRDRDPIPEIALWVHAARIYSESAAKETDPARRKHLYQLVVCCLTASPDLIRQVLPAGPLKDAEIDDVLRRFFPARPESGRSGDGPASLQ